tara:strand:+ start:1362 stop:2471 length:1110 start_codon:yes stop_codon:yes gene_type:complete
MNICLIGDGLISLTLAKALINKSIKVFMYYKKNQITYNQNRTIGITSNNLDFFQKEILEIKKDFAWKISEIEIYNEKDKEEKILNFKEPKKKLFSIIKNTDIINSLNNSLKINKNFKKIKINNKSLYKKIISNNNFDLIINCDVNNEISKKYFYKKIIKNYESKAYATIIKHNKINNKKAVQIFTKYGPLAFLPISKTQTSIVYSIKNKNINNFLEMNQTKFENLILKNNKKYKINYINKFETFALKSKTLRNYYYKNILAFGDMLHTIHPLSGQGFNMTLRDIKVFLDLILEKESLGLPIDYSICKDFENRTKHLNFIFSSGNDFIYEFFNYDNFYMKTIPKKLLNFLSQNTFFNSVVKKYADRGLTL